MDDGDLATITKDSISMSNIKGEQLETDITVLEDEWEEAVLGDFEHYMLKEIFEQPDALRQCITGRLDRVRGNGRLGGLKLSPLELSKLPHVRLLGCGTAKHAAEIGAFLIESLARVPSVAHISSEFRTNEPVINPNALHFAISQSGETADTLSAVKEIQLKGGQVHGVVNVVGSSIASTMCKRCLHSLWARTSSCVYQSILQYGCCFSNIFNPNCPLENLGKEKGKDITNGLQQIPHLIEEYLDDQGPIMEAVEAVKDAKSVLFLGRGISAPVAKEGALKLMEVAYIPCLAYPAGEMKHGPIALLEEGSPVIFIVPNDHVKEKSLSAIHECRARGAK